MALKLITTYSTDNIALNGAASKIILMESPAPHAHGDIKDRSVYDEGVSYSATTNAGLVMADVLDVSRQNPSVNVTFYMFYKGFEKLTFTLSAGENVFSYYATITLFTVANGTSPTLYLSYSTSLVGQVAVPYYRYRMSIVVNGFTSIDPADIGARWIKLVIS